MTRIIKFNPKNSFAADIMGESGCANCGHPLEHSAPEMPKDHLMKTHGLGHDCRIDMRGDPKCRCENPQPKKHQTIRPKPIAVGEKVALWEMWRGMRKNIYCTKCWEPFGLCKCSAEDHEKFIPHHYPRHLLNTTISACEPIEMRAPDEVHFEIRTPELEILLAKLPNEQHPFVKADTPAWNNRRFIDFFRKTYPAIEKEWVKFWIWKW